MYSNKLINERIRKLIGKEAMNVVSRKLGFSQFVLSEHFKNNERDWSLYLLDKICTHYKVSLDWLVFGEGDCAEQIKENLLLKDKIRSLEEERKK